MEGKSEEELIGQKTGVGANTMSEANIEPTALTAIEKNFLLLAERGDCGSVKALLAEYKDKPEEFDINCKDPLDRTALIAAIENENMELINILLEKNIRVGDALLHAIKEEYVEAVEILLQHEEESHVEGQPYSWEAVDRSSSNFTPDITPLILAAHTNNYEILKILLDRGATLPIPHEIRCACDECVASREADSLRHSQSRINAYRALTAPSLIALSSKDPILTAFELSWELRRMSKVETEFRTEYNEMRTRCQDFATSLLDHTRTSAELEIMLNYDPEAGPFDVWQPGDHQSLERLKLAIKYKQKQFVAHPNVQQLLAAIWYEGLPGFRRKGMLQQFMELGKLGAMFPVYTTIYMMAPTSQYGVLMKKPFIKFVCHSASYGFFLMLLGAASQRIESLVIDLIGTEWSKDLSAEWKRKERGSIPGLVESVIILYIISLIWSEVRSLWRDGILEYITDLWNIVDFITYSFYSTWIFLRATAWIIVQKEEHYGLDPYYPRENWHMFDPMLISEGAFAAGMIFSFLKLVHIFSVNPHLGPLQISLGRMIIDIIKFFFIYTLVLFAFGCGLNQLMWYYADLEKRNCYHLPGDLADFDDHERACTIWRRFANLFETSQSLFWAGFGLVDLMNFELTGIKGFTRFWALLMFGSYSVINIIVLLNMLIAMMSNSYQIISERSDIEWKFARSKLWVSYFEDGDTVPPPFNLLPTVKNIQNWIKCGSGRKATHSMMKKSRSLAQERHEGVMKLLVRRYVTAEQRKRDEVGITEDDVMEIRQDISTLKFEIIDILGNNGMKTPKMDPRDSNIAGKKGRVMERRLLKDFQIGLVEGILSEAIKSEKEPKNVFSKIAKAIGRKASTGSKKDWNAIVRQGTLARNPIGSTHEARRRRSRQSIRRHILESQGPAFGSIDPERLVEYNPKLSLVSPATRVAYAKFKINKIKSEYTKRENAGADTTSEQSVRIHEPPSSDQGESPPDEVTSESETTTKQHMSVKLKGTESFRSRTPIQEDPREVMPSSPQKPQPSEEVKSEPSKPVTPSPVPSPSPKPPSPQPSTSKVVEPTTPKKEEPSTPQKEATEPETPVIVTPSSPKKEEEKEDEKEKSEAEEAPQPVTPAIVAKPRPGNWL